MMSCCTWSTNDRGIIDTLMLEVSAMCDTVGNRLSRHKVILSHAKVHVMFRVRV